MRFLGNDLILGEQPNRTPLVLSREARRGHLAIFGGSRTGKSKICQDGFQQEIANWHYSGCGAILIDPHGNLFDNVMGYLAATGFPAPVVPIDLRRADRTIAYNFLRRRDAGEPSVFVANFMEAILHAWGQRNTDQTPKLALWLFLILKLLYDQGHTLDQVVQLIAEPVIRERLIAQVEDAWERYNWKYLHGLEKKPEKLREELSSTIHKLQPFVSKPAIRASLCQKENSFDLSKAIEEGWIVLVCLSTAGGQISESDARLFGAIFLSDLTTSMMLRPKQENEDVRPTYLWIDEAANFVTPAIARGLDQLSGYGLHMNLVAHYPSQYLHSGGEAGRHVADSVMVNCQNKVIFRLKHPTDTEMLASSEFLQTFDENEIKFQPYSTKVLAHQVVYMPTYNSNHTDGVTANKSRTMGSAQGIGGATSVGRQRSHAAGTRTSNAELAGESYLEPLPPNDAVDAMINMLGGGIEPRKTLNNSRSQSGDTTEIDSDALTETDTESWHSEQSKAVTEGRAKQSSDTTGKAESPVIFPILGREKSAPMFRPLDEQKLRAIKQIAGQPDRHCIASIGGQVPVSITTRTVRKLYLTAGELREFGDELLRDQAFSLSTVDALHRIEERARLLRELLMRPAGKENESDEPVGSGRPVGNRPHVRV